MRDATLADIPRLVEMSRPIHGGSIHAHIPFVGDDAGEVFRRLIVNDDGLALIGDKGFFAGAITPFHFNLNAFRVVEIGYGGGPLKETIAAVRERAKPRNVLEINFAVERGPRARGLARLMKWAGGKPSLVTYRFEV